ncbi:late embryogenesis abundant protein D-34-like [Pistacia vera]|uniref:late embryogenesis abundant protein D-34-like n=1 Tax=Pistacia vera TaxID=55513 RepID=UPI0012632287|nr:late embryogenesis abundant protein D-34-like [Pistacia vera]XP_031254957.1 late embryogenesis abundant protein D-34-like [Pistacia vera]
MSQQQPRRPQADQSPQQEPIKYGDVFDVSGKLASNPIAPRDAASIQAAENMVLGQTQKGGPAAVMQSAATVNQRAGLVNRGAVSDTARDQGVTVTETVIDGQRVIVEAVGDQIVGQYEQPDVPKRSPGAIFDPDSVTIGEALEATALSVGDKPVDKSDAAAIYAAEVRASSNNEIKPGGVGAIAQSAAAHNQRTMFFADKTTISDVLADATTKLPGDKPVTREDAEGVISSEIRNKADLRTTPGGVASSMAAAARFNQNK